MKKLDVTAYVTSETVLLVAEMQLYSRKVVRTLKVICLESLHGTDISVIDIFHGRVFVTVLIESDDIPYFRDM